MAQLTWKQFKDKVETALKEADKSEDTEVWYIDITYPNEHMTVRVEEGEITITD